MNGSSRKEHLKLISSNPDVFTLDLAKRNSPLPHHDSLVAKAQRTFASIGDSFSDTSAIALYDAKALRDVPAFCKDYLNEISEQSADNFYTNISGEPILIETLSAYGKKLGLAHTERQNILVTAGAVNAFYSICYALCDEGDVILALSPSYILFAHSMRTFGAEMVLVPSSRKDGKFIVDAETLENKILEVKASGRKIKAVLTVNPTNIDSQCWTSEEIEALAPVLLKHNLLIIEDRVYDGLQYDAPENAAFFANHAELGQRTVTIDSVSKKYGATQWRIGWIYAPAKLIELASAAVMQSIWSPNSKYQIATALMLLSGMSNEERSNAAFSDMTRELAIKAALYAEKHQQYFENLHRDYLQRRDQTIALINGSDQETTGVCGFSAPVTPQAGMFLLIQADKAIFEKLSDYRYPDLVFAKFLYKEMNVSMLPSTELTLPEEERMFRMEFGIEESLLNEALNRIDAFTRKFLSMTPDEIQAMERAYLSEQEIYSSKKAYLNTVGL